MPKIDPPAPTPASIHSSLWGKKVSVPETPVPKFPGSKRYRYKPAPFPGINHLQARERERQAILKHRQRLLDAGMSLDEIELAMERRASS